ncbi:hypothetical protein JB92DRAFT_2932639 [Gautieria morchelliformis]|nr:hypothetical protein JB92DRAFT_2932639 [Gautieria morchelliformis]
MPLVPAGFSPPPYTETDHSEILPKSPKRKLNYKYRPLFIFAFENDPFPTRKEREHHAHISGMSLRQISAWFQHRRYRCRTPPRAKSQLKHLGGHSVPLWV